MALPQGQTNYTYADYLKWEGDSRYELLDGEAIMMAPPSRIHQKVSGELFYQLRNFLESKQCEVYTAPFAVRLFEKDGVPPDDIQTVFEPDIVVVCDKNKLDDRGCKGAPNMVIEILSPSAQRHDRWNKYIKYQTAGVNEYWIVDPDTQTVQVFLLENGSYKGIGVYSTEDIVKVHVLQGCFIELSKVFAL